MSPRDDKLLSLAWWGIEWFGQSGITLSLARGENTEHILVFLKKI